MTYIIFYSDLPLYLSHNYNCTNIRSLKILSKVLALVCNAKRKGKNMFRIPCLTF